MKGARFTHGFGVCLCKNCARTKGQKKFLKKRRVALARLENKKIVKKEVVENE